MSDRPSNPEEFPPPGGWQPPPPGMPPQPMPPGMPPPPPYGAAPPPFGAVPQPGQAWPAGPGQPWGGPFPAVPPPKKRRWPIVLAGAVGVVVALGVLGTLVGTTSDPDDDDATTAPIAVTPASGPVIQSGGISITLPAGWLGADVAGGVSGLGGSLFPADPDLAAGIDGLVSLLPRSVSILGVEEEDVRRRALFVSNVTVLIDPSVPPGMDFDDVVRAEENGIRAVGAELVDSDTVVLGGREVGRLHARFEAMGSEAIGYVIVEGDETWVVTYSFALVTDQQIALADGSVATLRFG